MALQQQRDRYRECCEKAEKGYVNKYGAEELKIYIKKQKELRKLRELQDYEERERMLESKKQRLRQLDVKCKQIAASKKLEKKPSVPITSFRGGGGGGGGGGNNNIGGGGGITVHRFPSNINNTRNIEKTSVSSSSRPKVNRTKYTYQEASGGRPLSESLEVKSSKSNCQLEREAANFIFKEFENIVRRECRNILRSRSSPTSVTSVSGGGGGPENGKINNSNHSNAKEKLQVERKKRRVDKAVGTSFTLYENDVFRQQQQQREQSPDAYESNSNSPSQTSNDFVKPVASSRAFHSLFTTDRLERPHHHNHRRHKKPPPYVNCPSNFVPESVQHAAASKIQAAYKSYKIRSILSEAKLRAYKSFHSSSSHNNSNYNNCLHIGDGAQNKVPTNDSVKEPMRRKKMTFFKPPSAVTPAQQAPEKPYDQSCSNNICNFHSHSSKPSSFSLTNGTLPTTATRPIKPNPENIPGYIPPPSSGFSQSRGPSALSPRTLPLLRLKSVDEPFPKQTTIDTSRQNTEPVPTASPLKLISNISKFQFPYSLQATSSKDLLPSPTAVKVINENILKAQNQANIVTTKLSNKSSSSSSSRHHHHQSSSSSSSRRISSSKNENLAHPPTTMNGFVSTSNGDIKKYQKGTFVDLPEPAFSTVLQEKIRLLKGEQHRLALTVTKQPPPPPKAAAAATTTTTTIITEKRTETMPSRKTKSPTRKSQMTVVSKATEQIKRKIVEAKQILEDYKLELLRSSSSLSSLSQRQGDDITYDSDFEADLLPIVDPTGDGIFKRKIEDPDTKPTTNVVAEKETKSNSIAGETSSSSPRVVMKEASTLVRNELVKETRVIEPVIPIIEMMEKKKDVGVIERPEDSTHEETDEEGYDEWLENQVGTPDTSQQQGGDDVSYDSHQLVTTDVSQQQQQQQQGDDLTYETDQLATTDASQQEQQGDDITYESDFEGDFLSASVDTATGGDGHNFTRKVEQQEQRHSPKVKNLTEDEIKLDSILEKSSVPVSTTTKEDETPAAAVVVAPGIETTEEKDSEEEEEIIDLAEDSVQLEILDEEHSTHVEIDKEDEWLEDQLITTDASQQVQQGDDITYESDFEGDFLSASVDTATGGDGNNFTRKVEQQEQAYDPKITNLMEEEAKLESMLESIVEKSSISVSTTSREDEGLKETPAAAVVVIPVEMEEEKMESEEEAEEEEIVDLAEDSTQLEILEEEQQRQQQQGDDLTYETDQLVTSDVSQHVQKGDDVTYGSDFEGDFLSVSVDTATGDEGNFTKKVEEQEEYDLKRKNLTEDENKLDSIVEILSASVSTTTKEAPSTKEDEGLKETSAAAVVVISEVEMEEEKKESEAAEEEVIVDLVEDSSQLETLEEKEEEQQQQQQQPQQQSDDLTYETDQFATTDASQQVQHGDDVTYESDFEADVLPVSIDSTTTAGDGNVTKKIEEEEEESDPKLKNLAENEDKLESMSVRIVSRMTKEVTLARNEALKESPLKLIEPTIPGIQMITKKKVDEEIVDLEEDDSTHGEIDGEDEWFEDELVTSDPADEEKLKREAAEIVAEQLRIENEIRALEALQAQVPATLLNLSDVPDKPPPPYSPSSSESVSLSMRSFAISCTSKQLMDLISKQVDKNWTIWKESGKFPTSDLDQPGQNKMMHPDEEDAAVPHEKSSSSSSRGLNHVDHKDDDGDDQDMSRDTPLLNPQSGDNNSKEISTSVLSIRAFNTLLFDLIQDTLKETLQIEDLDSPIAREYVDRIRPGSLALAANKMRVPKTRENLIDTVLQKIKNVLPYPILANVVPVPRRRLTKWTSRPRDLVDEVLAEELIETDREWTESWPEEIIVLDKWAEKYTRRALGDVINAFRTVYST